MYWTRFERRRRKKKEEEENKVVNVKWGELHIGGCIASDLSESFQSGLVGRF